MSLLSDASRIVDVIDQRVKALLFSEAYVETTWGEVASLSDDGQTASLYLYGETSSSYTSDGFRVPAALYLTVGDTVKCAMDKARGDRWVIDPYIKSAYKKVALDTAGGRILMGNGTAAPTPGGTVPPGVGVPYAGSTAPAGWLLCDGSSKLRTDYPDLFAALGGASSPWGLPDGTHFNVPDMRGKFPLGKATSGTGSTLGGTGGNIDHTHTGPSHTHTQPTHTHTGPSHTHSGPSHTHTGPSHTHSVPDHDHTGVTSTVEADAPVAGTGNVRVSTHHHTIYAETGIDTGSGGTGNTGSGGTGNTGSGGTGATGADGDDDTGASGTAATGTANPPFATWNYIIKT
jgi:microcystin-dependent protein